MKKKISVFALLLSLLLAVLVPAKLPVPVQAANSTETTADDVKYEDIEDFMHGAGYYEFTMVDDSHYFALLYGDYLYVYEVVGFSGLHYAYDGSAFWIFKSSNSSSDTINEYKFYNFTKAMQLENYSCLNTQTVNNYTRPVYGNGAYYNDYLNTYYTYSGTLDNFLYSDLAIYSIAKGGSSTPSYYKDTSVVLFESTKHDGYVFSVWCADAGLNCLASSNESPTKIPYSYNNYWHIVRRTSSGKWLLTTIGNSKNQEGMQLRLSEDNSKLIIYNDYEDDGTDSSNNGYLANVRQYEYDTDGWKVRSYDTIDFSDTEEVTIELEAGTGLDDTRLLAYTNTDIYSFNGYAILHEASTEYYEVTDTPTVTPEPTPGSGSSGSGDSDDTGSDDSGSSGSGSSGGGRPGSGTRPSLGGEASGGGGLDFIINLFTLIWTKICAVPMSVDGYSISLQQLFVYGALVSIVGGFIMKFIFRR